MVGALVGALIQLARGQGFARKRQGNGVRCGDETGFDQFM
jgi:hypothetical protein